MIPVVEVGFRNGARSASTFSHILTGHLEVNAASVSALGLMHLEKPAHLFKDQVERARLVSGSRCDRVSMHWIAGPQHNTSFTFDRSDEWRQEIADLFRPEAADQCEAARFVVGIEQFDQPKKIVGFQRRTALQSDRIFDPSRILDMCMVMLACPIANPDHVA